MQSSKKKNPYPAYFSDFSQKAENKHLNFAEMSVKAAQTWKVLEETEKNKYRTQCRNGSGTCATINSDVDNGISYLCSICGRYFKAAFRFRFHIKTCGSVDVSCPICEKVLKTKEGLQKHIRFVHNKEKLYSCPECQKQFKCHADFKSHFNIHEGVRLKCDHCDSTFSNMSNKNKHNKKFH